MFITKLKSKIAYATVTQTELYYVGSITIDEHWMRQANIVENEQVHIVNLNNGERLETYVIKGEPGSGVIAINGPAARRAAIGDEIFILSYAQVSPDLVFNPIVVDLKDRS
jgi:aspartate 1-decarboxylase